MDDFSHQQRAPAADPATAGAGYGPRRWSGRRWLSITLRSLHLVGTAGVGGGFLYGAPEAAWLPYLWMLAGSGVGMVVLQSWGNPLWLVQLRGISVLAKLALLACLLWTPAPALPLFVAVIVISGVIAHAPGDVRYFSVWHWRRYEGRPANSATKAAWSDSGNLRSK